MNLIPETIVLTRKQLLYLILMLIVIIYFVTNSRSKTKQKKHKSKIKDQTTYQFTQWSPTGWYWDEKKNEWIPPDYLSKEANTRWKWDEKKQIWIDLQKRKEK